MTSLSAMSLTGNNVANEDAVYTLTLGNVDAPGQTITSYTVHWGDDTAVTYTAAQIAASNGQVTHTYTAPSSSSTITVDVIASSTTYTSLASKVISVKTLTLSGATTTTAGSSYALTLNNINDLDTSSLAVVVHWGDGTSTQTYSGSDLATANYVVAHTYADGGNTATIRVDLLYRSQTYADVVSQTITINAPTTSSPYLTISGSSCTDEGAPYDLLLSSSVTTLTSWTVYWGDGSSNMYPAVPLSYTNGVVTHKYAAGPNSYTITATATDGTTTYTTGGTAGSLDVLYNGNGKATTTLSASSGAVIATATESDGATVVLSSNTDGTYRLTRFLSNGTLDPNFGTNGVVNELSDMDTPTGLIACGEGESGAVEDDIFVVGSREQRFLCGAISELRTVRYVRGPSWISVRKGLEHDHGVWQ